MCVVCAVCVVYPVYVMCACVVCVWCNTHTQIMGCNAVNLELKQSSSLSLPPTPDPSHSVM